MSARTILFVESGRFGGGSFHSLLEHVRLLSRERYRPLVVFFNTNSLIPIFEKEGVQVYLVDDPVYTSRQRSVISKLRACVHSQLIRFLPSVATYFECKMHGRSLKAIARIIEAENVQVLHLNDQINRDFFVASLVDKFDLKCVSHLRSMSGANFHYDKAKRSNRYVSLFLANSFATRQYWSAQGLEENKIIVLYNPVAQQPESLPESERSRELLSAYPFVVGCVASLEKRKGHLYLLDAFKRFLDCCPDAQLVLVGQGPLKGLIEKRVELLQLSESVKLLGYREDARELIAEFDVLVLPSREEAFGRVVLEAMQAQTPVIATRVGGIPEIVEDGLNGLIVEFGDICSLSEALAKIRTDQELAKELVKNALRTVNEQFSAEHYRKEVEKLYSVL